MKKLLYSIILLSSLHTSNGFGVFCCWHDQAESNENKKPKMMDAATMTDEAADENKKPEMVDAATMADEAAMEVVAAVPVAVVVVTDENKTDLLSNIFNYLSLEEIAQARRVSKRWHNATSGSSFDTFALAKSHKNFDLCYVAFVLRGGNNAGFRRVILGSHDDVSSHSDNPWISEKKICDFLDIYGNNIEFLGLYINSGPNDDALKKVEEKCHNLRYLGIAGDTVPYLAVKDLAVKCPHLANISLSCKPSTLAMMLADLSMVSKIEEEFHIKIHYQIIKQEKFFYSIDNTDSDPWEIFDAFFD
ncbi:MAG: F-box protein [Candidatus Babeliales bacterium]|jgi:hypothetical protein